MKKTTKLLAGAMAVAIGGLAMTGMASAVTVTPVEGETVSYTLNGNDSLVFTAGVLKIDDGTTNIWILDRNLGATQIYTGLHYLSTFGYYFQRGNNYGFNGNPTSISSTQVQALSLNYNPLLQQYFSSNTFITQNDNWLNDDSIVDLWGGSTDDYISSLNGYNWKVNSEQVEQRRGPCPENFHVPSYGEFLKIRSLMGIGTNKIQSELFVPFAGWIKFNDAQRSDVATMGCFRSSSPFSMENSYSYDMSFSIDWGLNVGRSSRAYACSVRCVYDSYETYTPSGNLSSEGEEPQVIVNIAEFNGGQNTCTGSNFIFDNIIAGTDTESYTLTGIFECAFGNGSSHSSVTLQLSGNLVASGDKIISGSNVEMMNSEWTVAPTGLKFADTLINTYHALTATQTIFQKSANLIGAATGEVTIRLTVPGGTPDGIYNGTLVLTY